ncbi:hypothetical protein A2U01_0098366, partial [Trifolium medium]|nr:hypothetical protein [Trifolium medium]
MASWSVMPPPFSSGVGVSSMLSFQVL